MGLQIKRSTHVKVRILSTVIAAFALIAQPMYGVLASYVANATSATTISTTSLSTQEGWDVSQTRSAGHSQVVANGVHVWTTPSGGSYTNEQSKAAAYHAADFALKDAGDVSIDIAPGYTGVRPSLQLGVDKDGNGTQDGYLVYEPWSYGTGQFWTNTAGFGVAPGLGYKSLGSISQYVAANPDARVTSIGYSLGSGVVGDAVITKLTAGGVDYTFKAAPPTAPSNFGFTSAQNDTSNALTCDGATNVAPQVINGDKFIWAHWDSTPHTTYQIATYMPDGTRYHNSSTAKPNPYRFYGFGSQGDGVYRIKVTAYDTRTKLHSTATNCSLRYDTQGPAFSLDAPTSNTDRNAGKNIFISNKGDIVVSGKASDVSGFTTKVSGGVYDQTTNTQISSPKATVQSDGSWSYTIPEGTLTEGDLINVSGGIRDSLGNGPTSVHVYFTVDSVAPTITVKPNFVGNEKAKIFSNVSFKLHDNRAVDYVMINDHKKDLTNNAWSDADFGAIKQYFKEGSNTITVFDTAGNSSDYKFTYDSTKPYVKSFVQKFDKVDSNGLNREKVTLVFSEPVDGSSISGGQWNGSGDTFTKVYYSTKDYTVTFKDLAGNENSYDFSVDATAPDAPYNLLVNGRSAPFYTQSTNRFERTWDANKAPNDVVKYVYKSFSSEAAAQNPSVGGYSKDISVRTGQTTYSLPGTANHTFWWLVGAVDAVGNTTWSQVYNVIVDDEAPVIGNVTFKGNAFGANTVIKGSDSFNVKETEENPWRTYVEVDVMQAGKWKKLAGNWSTGSSANSATLSFNTTDLDEKAHYQLKISSDDSALNHASQSIPFTIDNTPPAAPTISPASGTTAKGQFNYTVAAAASDGGHVSKVEQKIGDSGTWTQVGTGADTYTIDTTTLIKGTNIYVRATSLDDAGNPAHSSEHKYTVNNNIVSGLTINDPASDNNGKFTLSGTVIAPAGSEVIVTNENGVRYGVGTVDADGNWSVLVGNLSADTPYQFYVTVSDATGLGYSDMAHKRFTTPTVNVSSVHQQRSLFRPFATTATPAALGVQTQQQQTLQGAGDSSDTGVLGAQDTKGNKGVLGDTATLASSSQGWKILGFAWYWWLLLIAAVLALWWFLAARRRASENA